MWTSNQGSCDLFSPRTHLHRSLGKLFILTLRMFSLSSRWIKQIEHLSEKEEKSGRIDTGTWVWINILGGVCHVKKKRVDFSPFSTHLSYNTAHVHLSKHAFGFLWSLKTSLSFSFLSSTFKNLNCCSYPSRYFIKHRTVTITGS